MFLHGFIVSRQHLVDAQGSCLIFQGRLNDGRRFHWRVTHPFYCFYVQSQTNLPQSVKREKTTLRTLDGHSVDLLSFAHPAAKKQVYNDCVRSNIATYEADIKTVDRFLMSQRILSSVTFKSQYQYEKKGCLYFCDPIVEPNNSLSTLRVLSLDIECSMQHELFSIALYSHDFKTVLMRDELVQHAHASSDYISCASETQMMQKFFKAVSDYDPDILIGWNVIGFDLHWLAKKCASLGLNLNIGTDGPAEIFESEEGYRKRIFAKIPGRVALDGIDMLRAAFIISEDYSLNTVAQMVLGKSKTIEKTGEEKIAEIERQFRYDKKMLARYNLEDSKLAYEIFKQLNLILLAQRKSQITGLAIDKMGGSVSAFDRLYLPRLHEQGYVSNTLRVEFNTINTSPGGLVLDSVPGFYRHVCVFDFKSLYPSLIRTFKIDPLAKAVAMRHTDYPCVRGPTSYVFSTTHAILPDIVGELWLEREAAKRCHDATLSQAIKIIMNSFYGVLGSPGCRFYDPDLTSAITLTGQWILSQTRDEFEKKGYHVIYGDTDSLFVQIDQTDFSSCYTVAQRLKSEINTIIAQMIRERFNVESFLELQFDKLFKAFFLPKLRDDENGSKKKYAGLLVQENHESELYVAGLETKRRDWTLLAREFQKELLLIALNAIEKDKTPHQFVSCVKHWHQRLLRGELDAMLEYRKTMSKPLKFYTKNIPPHVQAAQQLNRFLGGAIRYVITSNGPEPIQKRSGAPLDYSHYVQKQLEPIANMILRFFNLDFMEIIGGSKQLSLF